MRMGCPCKISDGDALFQPDMWAYQVHPFPASHLWHKGVGKPHPCCSRDPGDHGCRQGAGSRWFGRHLPLGSQICQGVHPPSRSGLGPMFPSRVQLFDPSFASLLLSSPQLRDRAGSAHGTTTLAVSRGKAVLSDAESLLASLEGKMHWPEHFQPRLGYHHAGSGCQGEKEPA